MTEKQIDDKIRDISLMSLEQIAQYKEKISLSSAHRDIKNRLYQACDSRASALETDRGSAMAEMGDIDDMGGY